ncbi:GDH/6PGL endoplasmic bifunctional protein [Saccoglossus kowalevskii]
MEMRSLFGFLLALVIVVSSPYSATTEVLYSNIILVGATGDLAKKYLWQGMFNLFLEKSSNDHIFHFYGSGRTPQETAGPALQKILEENVKCDNIDRDDCSVRRRQFIESTEYHQLKSADHYVSLTIKIEKALNALKVNETGTLAFLSVPPFTYADIVNNLHEECRPPDSWFRVVLEKPFGHDTESAEKLSRDIATSLKEDEIYRIDHYLGKPGVQQIMPFRFDNKDKYDQIWNKDHIERVEIVMKETLDCKGRMNYYDEYGVIRDVIQNHLTEILILIAMETPSNLTDRAEHHRKKLHLLKHVKSLGSDSCVIGQYTNYNTQVKDELKKDDDFQSVTPTFATVAMEINNPRWKGVPFILMSGKMMDEKSGYVRVVFKQNILCGSVPANEFNSCYPRQIVFVTGNSDTKHPILLVSKSLPEPNVRDNLKASNLESSADVFGLKKSDYFSYNLVESQDAYSNLITAAYEGRRDSFVGTEDLIASWKIWTPLLQSIKKKKPRLYPGGKSNSDWLNVVTLGNKIEYLYGVNVIDFPPDSVNTKTIPSHYRSQPLRTGNLNQVIKKLADDIEVLAKESVELNGVFHMALSGGNTPNKLLTHLVLHSDAFPWHHTHVWQVDERCVDLKSNLLNFNHINENLLQYVPVPLHNIHSMPVDLVKNEYEPGKDLGSAVYGAEIENIVPNESMDLILLGVGTDGHTASLFPRQSSNNLENDLVALVNNGPEDVSPKRMTMTLDLINKSKNVAVLVTGGGKKNIVSVLKDAVKDSSKWPITGVELVDGDMAWYIDHDALL